MSINSRLASFPQQDIIVQSYRSQAQALIDQVRKKYTPTQANNLFSRIPRNIQRLETVLKKHTNVSTYSLDLAVRIKILTHVILLLDTEKNPRSLS